MEADSGETEANLAAVGPAPAVPCDPSPVQPPEETLHPAESSSVPPDVDQSAGACDMEVDGGKPTTEGSPAMSDRFDEGPKLEQVAMGDLSAGANDGGAVPSAAATAVAEPTPEADTMDASAAPTQAAAVVADSASAMAAGQATGSAGNDSEAEADDECFDYASVVEYLAESYPTVCVCVCGVRCAGGRPLLLCLIEYFAQRQRLARTVQLYSKLF